MDGINSDYEQNHKDITSLLKDGLTMPVPVIGPDGQPAIEWRVDGKSAWWKTHNINSSRFGLLAESVESLEALANDAEYNMSAPRAAVIREQILGIVNVLRKSIDAKSSETMRDKRTAQTSLTDKYLKNKQERVIDLKGEAKRSLMDAITGKEAEKSTE